MKTLGIVFLWMTCFALPAFGQSAGGGGGGDRPMRIASSGSSKRVPQIDLESATCHEIKSALKVFGKVRLNSDGKKKQTFKLIADQAGYLGCTGSTPTLIWVTTRDKNSCPAGYTCEIRPSGR